MLVRKSFAQKFDIMKRPIQTLIFACLLIFSVFAKAQTNYFTEGFETGLPTTKPTIETSATLSSGAWAVKGAYRSATKCDGSYGLRFIGGESSYVVTPILSNGVSSLTFSNSRTSVRTMTFFATTKTDLATITESDWVQIGTAVSTNAGCAAGLYTVAFPQAANIAATDIRRIRIVNATANDNDIDGLTIASAVATVSSDVDVTAFKLPGQVGSETINYAAGTININVATGTNISNIAPTTFSISSGATVSPLATALQNFTNPVNYVVTAQDGTTTKNWTVTTTFILSSEKEVTAFKLSNDQIGNASINSATGQILVTMPINVSLSSLVPITLTLSNLANVSPGAGTAQDFSSPVIYTVTAQNGTTKQWTVNVVTVDPNLTFNTYEAENANFTGKVDTQHTGFSGTGFIDFLATGDNQITFTVCNQQAGVQTAKFRYSFAKDENRSAALYVNDVFVQTVDFPRTATFTDWTEVLVSVNLNAGVNAIKLAWETTDGPNLDRLDLSGGQCASYTLAVTTTNSGTVAVTPSRANNKYFSGEQVTLLAEEKPALKLDNWSGDLSGSTNPQTLTMNGNKTVTANFRVINTYRVTANITGIGSVTLSPAGGEYPDGTVVTITANTVLGSTFQGWAGDLSGTNATQTITINGNKTVTATFTDNLNINFRQPVGFASANGDGFNGPTTGGDAVVPGFTNKIIYINGPAEFNKLAQTLYNRIRYKYMDASPLTIVLEPGVYQDVALSPAISVWGNHMLDIQEQSNLTIIGRKNVVFKFGINVKRSSNIIIRNITFQDYYDDGINIGNTETHHIWVDHCTVGHPTTMPSDSEHPDGGIDIKDGASYVTISWTVYRNSWKTGLIGHSDNNAGTDVGRLKVTHYANHFLNTNSRNPRVRFGEVHVLNCLSDGVKLYGIAAAIGANVFAENNFYLNTRWGMYADRTLTDFRTVFGNNTDDMFTSKTGNKPAFGLKQVGNEYDDAGLPVITGQINPAMLNPGGRSVKFDELNAANVFNPSSYYSYTALPASVVRVIVPIYAGADKIDWFPQTLPLEFTAFEAKKAGTATNPQVNLNWKTAKEENTEKIEVLRKGANDDFVVINTQRTKNTAGEHLYSFVDRNPLAGENYYQLMQYDKDGKTTSSEVRLVTITDISEQLNAYPNPTSGLINIKHNAPQVKGIINVVDTQGQLKTKVVIAKGQLNTILNLSLFASGFYLLKVEIDGKHQQIKIIKK
jgi:pectate lyase